MIMADPAGRGNGIFWVLDTEDETDENSEIVFINIAEARRMGVKS
ncbi:MAG: hypothetical protein ACR2OZ_15965 [Verrucomicrobiales bacterium]